MADDEKPVDSGLAAALGSALTRLAGTPVTPLQDLAKLAFATDGAVLTVDFKSAAQIGVPVIVFRERRLEENPVLSGLSAREREVALFLRDGLSNKEIARRLGIAVSTVKDHVHSVLSKTGSRSRGHLAARFRAPK
jgi:DNA-binding CsgD family transcriptional regulator